MTTTAPPPKTAARPGPRVFASPDDLAAVVGQRLGESLYQRIDQARVDRFAELTGDHQWIHTDPQRARSGPFGTPIAHGFLVLSLLTAMLDQIFRVEGVDLVVNRGLDRIRFTAPVPVGTYVRAVVDLAEVRPRPRGYTEALLTIALEVEGRREPALRASQRLLYHRAEQPPASI